MINLNFPEDKTRKVIRVCSILFVFACLLHFFSQRPLWLDETFISENLVKLKISGLFAPLHPVQAFPRVYLMFVKILADIFNHHIFSYRIIPLMAMISGFFIWTKVYRKSSKSNETLILSVLAFICTFHFSYYASELKQYSMDVLVFSIYACFLICQKKYENSGPDLKLYLVSILLPFSICFSYASVSMFWLITYNYLFLIPKNKKLIKPFICNVLALVSAVAFFYYIDGQHTIQTSKMYHSYWDTYFICVDSVYCFQKSFFEGIQRLATWHFAKGKLFSYFAMPFVAFFLYGFVRHGIMQWAKEGFRAFSLEAISGLMIVQIFIFSFLQKYPFSGSRLTLFLVPLFLFINARVFQGWTKWKPLRNAVLCYYCLYLLACYIFTVVTYVRMYTLGNQAL